MLISKEQHWRSPGKKLEEQKHNKTTGLPGKTRGKEKTETYLDKPSLWLKRIIRMEHENVFLFEYALIVLSYRRY